MIKSPSPAPADGVLPDVAIRDLMRAGGVLGADAERVQPASLDLTLGATAWRVRASFLPLTGRTVRERLADGPLMHEIDLREGAVFERGCVYLVALRERLALPSDLAAAANPKSSTGRIDVFVRLVADGADAFDVAPAGYDGPLYAEISPRTFSILAREGSSLNQLRFKRGAPQIADADLARLHAERGLLDADADVAGGVGVRIDLSDATPGPVGWRARRHAGLIDVDAPDALRAEDFFEPVRLASGPGLILDPGEFYILASKERLRVPPDCAAEMTPISTGLGEFRVHYAGFFDPGFGWSDASDAPTSRAVLEVRSRDAPFLLDDGQLVARLVYERMAGASKALYGAGVGSNYQGQGLKLSKHFRMPT
ncbi:MAG: 2'-deoxycytidine 5'-triphosphate deaminase [Pseudomonadota bacterium]